LAGVATACALAACGNSGGTNAASNTSSGALTPCDPLAPPATTLGTVLGVGEDTQSVLYVADDGLDAGSGQRVFVSSGMTLVQQDVLGSGGGAAAPTASFTFTFEGATGDAGIRTLLIEIASGDVITMALSEGASRNLFLVPDAGQVPLTLLDAGALSGFAVQSLPDEILHVADVSDGHVIVVVEPGDPYGTSGFRLFYGTAAAMTEYPILSYDDDDYGEYVAFSLNGTTYHVFFNDPCCALASTDSGVAGVAPGPGALYTGGGGADPALTPIPGALTITERTPTPTTLSGFTFACLSP
jgi:hypothetical protein